MCTCTFTRLILLFSKYPTGDKGMDFSVLQTDKTSSAFLNGEFAPIITGPSNSVKTDQLSVTTEFTSLQTSEINNDNDLEVSKERQTSTKGTQIQGKLEKCS